MDEMERHLGRSIRAPLRGRPAKNQVDAGNAADDQREMLF